MDTGSAAAGTTAVLGLLLAGASVKVATGAGQGDRGEGLVWAILRSAGAGAARTEQEGTALVPALMLPEVWRDSCCILCG